MTEGTSCPVCGSQSRAAGSAAGVELRRCRRCDHCFTDGATLEAVETYGPEYFEQVHRRWFENPNLTLFDVVRRLVRRTGPQPRVVDVGCGRGQLLRYLRDRDGDLELTGIDLTPNPPEPGIEYLQADASGLSLGRTFDAVVSLATIEHIADVREFTSTLVALCRPGGLVLVMTLNDRSVLYGVARILAAAGYREPFDRLYDKHHLNHFNVRSLRTLMEGSGLEVLTTLKHNAPLNAMDIEAGSALGRLILRGGVLGTFAAGRAIGRTYLQTIVCQTPTHQESRSASSVSAR